MFLFFAYVGKTDICGLTVVSLSVFILLSVRHISGKYIHEFFFSHSPAALKIAVVFDKTSAYLYGSC